MGLRPSPWLSRVLGRPAHSVDESPFADTRLPAAPAFIDAKVDVERADRVAELTAAGFRLVTVNVQLKRPSGYPSSLPTGIAVRPARDGDRDAVSDIAGRAFTLDRFHVDPMIDRPIADRIKAEWAANFFIGERGDVMAVSEIDGRIAGFNLLFRRERTLIIDLIAVAPELQRRGVAGAMIDYAAAQWGDEREMVVGTQLTNQASLALYQRVGFRLESAAYVLHHHGTAA